MARFPGDVDGRRFLRAMGRFGWIVVSQRGSHRKLEHTQRSRFVIVAFHDRIHRNLARQILRDAGIDEDEFLQAL